MRYLCRTVHNVLSSLLAPVLLMLIITGCSWSVGRYWLGFEKDDVKWLIDLHQMKVLQLENVFPILTGGLTLGVVASGFCLTSVCADLAYLCQRRKKHTYTRVPTAPMAELSEMQDKQDTRRPRVEGCVWLQCSARGFHRLVASTVGGVALLYTTLTATIWCGLYRWGGYAKEDVKFLIQLHHGSYWLDVPTPYTLSIGFVILGLVLTGLPMTCWRSRALRWLGKAVCCVWSLVRVSVRLALLLPKTLYRCSAGLWRRACTDDQTQQHTSRREEEADTGTASP